MLNASPNSPPIIPARIGDAGGTARVHIDGHTGLRGIAAMVVVLGHMRLNEWFPGDLTDLLGRFVSWEGEAVDLFFMLSGFILYHNYPPRERVSWADYALARFARIYPLFLLCLVLCVALDAYTYLLFGVAKDNLDPSKILINVLLLNGLFANAPRASINPTSWSVSIEAILYCTAFPLLSLLVKNWRAAARLGPVLLIGGLTALLTLLYLPSAAGGGGGGAGSSYHYLLRGVLAFSIGFFIRLTLDANPAPPRRAGSAVLGAVSVLGVAVVLFFRLPRALLMPCFAVLVYATATNDTPLAGFLKRPVFRFLGTRSYSIYLIHYPVLLLLYRCVLFPSRYQAGFTTAAKLVTFPGLLIATLFLAEFSYTHFESPVRRYLRVRGCS